MPAAFARSFGVATRYARKLWPIRRLELAEPPPVVDAASDVIGNGDREELLAPKATRERPVSASNAEAFR
jgi:hypothetical protein